MTLSQETLAFISGSPSSERIPIELPTRSANAEPTSIDQQVGKHVLLVTETNKQVIGVGVYTGKAQDVVRVVSFDLRKEYSVEKVIFDKASLFSQRPLQAAKIKEFESYVTQVRKASPVIIQL